VDLRELGAGFGISRATAYRYRDEAVAVLTAQAPDLTEALQRIQADGWAYVILDGKIVDTDRCRAKTTSRKGEEIDLWYSGKKHDFGGNIQAVMRPDGCRSGSVRSNPDRFTTSPARRNTPSARSTPQPLVACRPWPTPATTVPVTACTPGQAAPPTGAAWISTTASTTCCCARYAESVNAASPC
jgi:hypothetical protein